MNETQGCSATNHVAEIGAPRKELRPLNDLAVYFQQYSRQKPHVVALSCLGIGFVLGWKLKPW